MPFGDERAERLLVALVYLVDEQDDGDGHLLHLLQKFHVLLRILHHISDIKQHVGIGQG